MAEENQENCTHECSSCPEAGHCSSKIEKAVLGKGASVKHVIGIVSGKGGVGKSFVASYLGVLLARKGYRVGILDADITGPSIPFAFGITAKAMGNEDNMIIPALSHKENIQIISSNMLLEHDTDPIIWRGPMIGQMVFQFYSEVLWEYLDFLLIDMPPGTGDVPLTIFQSIKMDGIIITTTPQGLVSMVVEKAANMAQIMKIPVLGLVSNMSYVKCPKCGEKIDLFGDNHIEEMKEKYGIPVGAEVPFDPLIAQYVDQGAIEDLFVDYLNPLVDSLSGMEKAPKVS
ncbi:MAG: Mrp/NBP35 family ATP-binding protein [Bacilli bacterium]|jgi:Mrp family chromosome partitioning ATPase|nr:Mrp/NBP35 family ATP-binding protein [Bacilli bacterium]